MNKQDKIKILNNLIEELNKIDYYKNKESNKQIIDRTKSFLNNAMDSKNSQRWESRIDEIYWTPMMYNTSTSDNVFAKYWEKGKKELNDVLNSIKNEISLYEEDKAEVNKLTKDTTISNEFDKKPIIFLSHSSKDKEYGNALRDLIIGFGVKNNQLIYTTHPLNHIPLGENIFEYLGDNIQKDTHMIILWSDNYLKSVPCICELGAGWVKKSDYDHIFTPGFNTNNIEFLKCPLDSKKIGILLEGDQLKTNMIELKNKIERIFNLKINEKDVSYQIDEFIRKINSIVPVNTEDLSLNVSNNSDTTKNVSIIEIQELIQGDDEYTISFDYNGKKIDIITTWNELLKSFGKEFIKGIFNENLKEIIADWIINKTEKNKSTIIKKIDERIVDEETDNITSQFKALGIIDYQLAYWSPGENDFYWTITPSGESKYHQLKVQKKKILKSKESK